MWTIDKICELTNKPSLLNALHACRDGHPLNKTADRPWRNAHFVAMQQPSYVIPTDACDWLLSQSRARGE